MLADSNDEGRLTDLVGRGGETAVGSLSETFKTGQSLYSQIDLSSHSSSHPDYQKLVAECIQRFCTCAFLIRQLALFSDNESLDDVNTTDLRYILVDFYLGEMTLKQISPDYLDRMQAIKVAQVYFSRFLTTLDDYGPGTLLHPDDLKRWRRMTRKNEDGDLEDGDDALVEVPMTRDEKIAQFKRERKNKRILEELIERTQPSHGTTDALTVDEEIERKILTTSAKLYAQIALESIRLIREERKILEHKATLMENNRGGQSGGEEGDASRVDLRVAHKVKLDGPLMNQEGKLLRPFVITSRREEMRRGVFRPGWNLPTMNIEEYLDREIERGNMLSNDSSQAKPITVEDAEEAVDAATYKARAWDDFTDLNTRGSGNRGGNRG